MTPFRGRLFSQQFFHSCLTCPRGCSGQGATVARHPSDGKTVRFSIPHRRRRVFSFFDFRSSFPVFPTSLKLRAEKKCCRTHIFLQNFVLIQPRTSPPKICKIFEKCIFEKCIFAKCIFALSCGPGCCGPRRRRALAGQAWAGTAGFEDWCAASGRPELWCIVETDELTSL